MRAAKASARLCGCVGSVEPWLLANTISTLSKLLAQMHVQCNLSFGDLFEYAENMKKFGVKRFRLPISSEYEFCEAYRQVIAFVSVTSCHVFVCHCNIVVF